MNAYRGELRRRMWVLVISGTLALVVVGTAGVYGYLRSVGSEAHMLDFSTGMATGLFIAMAAVTTRRVAQMRGALRDEGKLRAMYVAEHDERFLLIQSKTGAWPLSFATDAVVMAGAALSFAGRAEAGFVLMMAAAFMILLRAALKIYYNKKY